MNSLTRRYRRNPRPHERLWKDRCVDKNLKDEWLIRLNALQAFNLVSICEGHDSPARRPPHIHLRLKEEYFPIVSDEWHRSGQTMSRLINSLFSTEATKIEIELKEVFQKWQGRYNYKQDFTARIRCRINSESQSIQTCVVNWFQSIIPEIQELDTLIFDLCMEKTDL